MDFHVQIKKLLFYNQILMHSYHFWFSLMQNPNLIFILTVKHSLQITSITSSNTVLGFFNLSNIWIYMEIKSIQTLALIQNWKHLARQNKAYHRLVHRRPPV